MSEPRLRTTARFLTARLPRRAALLRLAGGAAAGLLATTGASGLARARVAAQLATPPAGGGAFIVLRRYQLRAGESMDELVTIVNEGFVPIIRTISGFREYLLVDAGSGAHLTISLFDDQAGAEASTAAAADWAAANVIQRIEGPAEVTEGWVRIQVSAGSEPETV
jgi:hypothetical protein